MFAESAFPRSSICFPLFKEPEPRTIEMRRISIVYNKYRVEVEHSIGMEKARFPSLRCIPVTLRDHASHELVMLWCKACTAFHNVSISENDPQWGWLDEDAANASSLDAAPIILVLIQLSETEQS